MSDSIVTRFTSPTDGNFQGPDKYYKSGSNGTGDCTPVNGWKSSPKCPMCGGEFGQHNDKNDCPHRLIEQYAQAEFLATLAEADESRGWLMDSGQDGKFTYGG